MLRRAIICLAGTCGALLLSAGLAGCGGSNTNNGNPLIPASITVTPTTISMDQGSIVQLVVVVKNSAGSILANQNVTFTSSAAGVATVSSGGTNTGLVCGGSWNSLSTPVVCTAGSVGTATITASVASLSATTTVFVHQHITNITLSPASVNCDHQGAATLFTATAFNNATDITSTVGPFTWTSNDTNVATIAPNSAQANLGTGTAVNPGGTSVFASASGTNSVPATFITCPVVSISAHVSGSAATSFTVAVSATQALAADVLDSTGQPVSVPLTWIPTAPAIAGVNSSGVAIGVAAGTGGIIASCSPPGCNNGLNSPVYSNTVTATVTGALGGQTVFATSSLLNPACGTAASGTCTSVVPIAVGTTTAGAAITLPGNAVANSLVFPASQTTGYLGSAQGTIILNGNTNAITGAVTNAVGKVLAVSPNGVLVIVSNPGVNVSVFNTSANTVQTLNITNATAADFTPDSFKAYIVGGSTLYVFSPGFALRTVALGGTANDVNFLSNGSFGYVAGPGASAPVFATCDNSLQDTVTLPGTPLFIRKAPTTLKMAAVDSPNLEIITAAPTTPPPSSCPPTLTDSLATVNTGVAFTPNALIVTPDGSKALITSNLTEVTEVDLNTQAVTHIPLANGAHAFTGGTTLDSTILYVGGSDGAVHIVDLRNNTDTRVPINFPNQAAGIAVDIVAVRP